MAETTVVNVIKGARCDILIGRSSIWGNPFVLQPRANDQQRALVIAQYAEYLLTQPQLIAQIHTLRGKTLGCYCKPKACHGDILADLANKLEDPA